MLHASNDLGNLGGQIVSAGGSISLTAGRDLMLQTRTLDTRLTTTTAQGTSTSSRTAIDRIATVQAGGNLLLSAGRDLSVQGASVTAAGDLSATAGRDLTVSAVQGRYQIDVQTIGGANTQGRTGYISQASTTSQASNLSAANITLTAGTDASQATADLSTSRGNLSLAGSNLAASGNIALQGNSVSISAAKSSQSAGIQTVQKRAYDRAAQSDETLVGGNLSAGNNLSVTATGGGIAGQGDITLQGARLVAGGQASLVANNNLSVLDATAAHTSANESYHRDKGLIKSTDTTASSQTAETRSTGSSISAGGTTALVAGTDLGIQGGNIAGDQGVLLSAGRNLIATESRSSTDRASSQDIHQSGLAGSFMGVPLPGTAGDKISGTDHTEAVDPTRISSSAGAVRIVSNGSTALQGVQVKAAQGISVQGGEVITAGAVGVANSTSEHATHGTNIGMTGWHDLGKGIDAHAKNTATDQTTGLARTTIEAGGQGVSITATGQNGTSGDLTLAGTTIAAPSVKLSAANNLNLNIQATQNLTDRSRESGDVGWQKFSGKGQSGDTIAYNQINSSDLSVSAKAINLQVAQPPAQPAPPAVPLDLKGAASPVAQTPLLTPAQQLQATADKLQTQPGMAWIGQLQNDPNLKGQVNLQAVTQAAQSWDYHQQGLTKEGAAVIAVVVAYFTAGAASGLAAGAGNAAAVSVGEGVVMTSGATFVTATGATISTVVGGAVTAGVSALASEAAVALVNNKGDVGKALHDLGSSANVKGLVTAVLTGGVLAGLNLNPTGAPTEGAGASQFTVQLQRNLQAAAAKAVINSAIYGTSLEDSLKTQLKGALLDTVAAQAANTVGDLTKDGTLDDFANKVAHAVAGCAVGAARTSNGAGCSAGALGAAVGELSAEVYGRKGDTVQFASMVSGIAAAVAGQDVNVASAAGGNAAANNFLNHDNVAKLADAFKKYPPGSPERAQAIDDAYAQSAANDARLLTCKATATCDAVKAEYVQGYKDIAALVDAGLPSTDVESMFRLENTAQLILNNKLQNRQCVTADCKATSDLLLGISKGLAKVTPAGMVAGTGVAAYELTTSIINNGAGDTAIAIVKGIAGLPRTLLDGLNSANPQVRGEALVDALSTGTVATVVTAKLVQAGVGMAGKVAASQLDQAATDAQRIQNNLTRDGGIADPSKPMSAMGPWTPAAAVTAAQADLAIQGALPIGAKIVGTQSADALNALGSTKGWLPSFLPGTQIVEVTTVQSGQFVRVYGDGSSAQAGGWMMRADDIAGLTPQQIASKFALPEVPTMMTDVTVPAGTRLDVSAANGISPNAGKTGTRTGDNGGGGGVQYQIKSDFSKEDFQKLFSNPRPLSPTGGK